MSHNEISRRQLLKGAIATGGAVITASMLPQRWLKPVVDTGVLPVHAQSSAPIQPTPLPTIVRTITGPVTSGWVEFDFNEEPISLDDLSAAPFTKLEISWSSGVATPDYIYADFILSTGSSKDYSDAFAEIMPETPSPIVMDIPTGIDNPIIGVEFNFDLESWDTGTMTFTFTVS